jgi:hypothetical protein
MKQQINSKELTDKIHTILIIGCLSTLGLTIIYSSYKDSNWFTFLIGILEFTFLYWLAHSMENIR